MRPAAAIGVTLVLAGLLAMPSAAAARSCKPVKNPYPNTRYEGSDLTRIRAAHVSCRTARRVAKGAHYKALRIPPVSPVRRFTWKGWKVTGDLRGSSDRYLATKGRKRVRWRF